MSTLHHCVLFHLLQQNPSDDSHDKDAKEKERYRDRDNSPKTAASPTLAELNTDGPRMKKPAFPSPYSPSAPTATSLPPHFSSAVSDGSLSSHPSPRIAFAEREGFDDLSASFRSLYKSIFGQSVNSGEYINAPTSVDAHQLPVPSVDPGCSNSSLVLGASAASLFNPGHQNYSPQLTSLMDSFRDIAESNSWDKLDSAQIQGLMESFKAGEHDKFGLDPEAYAELSVSFNQFLSQLNNKFLTSSAGSIPRLNEYHHQPHSHLGRMSQAHMISRMPPKYGRQGDSMMPYGIHRTSPPSSNFHSANRTPSPHISPPSAHMAPMCGPITSSHSHMSPHYTSFLQGHTPPLPSIAQPTDTSDVPIRSAATDLFEEEDDFDWSKLM